MSPPILFVSHCSREGDLARGFIEELRKRLRGVAGVRIDQREIRGGKDWEEEVWNWCWTCDAAAVVCSAAALDSRWVFLETVILLQRRRTGSEIHIFPVLVEPVLSEDLKDYPWSDLAKLRAGTVTAADMEAALADLVAQLHALAELDSPGRPLREWEDRIGAILGHWARDGRWVIDIRRLLHEPDETLWPDVVGLQSRLLARELLACPDRDKRKAVAGEIAKRVDQAGCREIRTFVVAAQIPSEAVRPLQDVLLRPRGDRAVVLGTDERSIGDLWVLRASERVPHWEPIEAKRPVSLDPAADVSDAARAELEQRYNTNDAERINRLLNRQESEGRPVFLILPLAGIETELPRILEKLYRTFEPVAFLLLTGGLDPNLGPFIPVPLDFADDLVEEREGT